jgi:thymidylate synthase (FAD)
VNPVKVLDKGYVRLVDTLGDDLSVVNAARVSYAKESLEFDERDERLLNFLFREGHTSPLRHAALTFEVYAPLMVARQWWKYAVGSTHTEDQHGWNESSRRYITENEEFYLPNETQWRYAPENSKQGSGGKIPWRTHIDEPEPRDDGGFDGNSLSGILKWWQEKSITLYKELLDSGVAPEQARLVLPANGMYVRWRWTISLAGVLHFLEERLGHDAQFEIQEYARAIETLVNIQFPMTTDAWVKNK